ncbi:unnamed protein product [Anisakis simplex]|uniref:GHMP kinase N-terminal domain-containing protein n=1 Tax=Anisakis simplex TaxID=6269 RepID=A0A3P6R7U4_ANISI|nr:unnamed protein product [Anisakis simplex]
MYTMVYGRKAKDPTRGYTMVYSGSFDEIAKIMRPYDNRENVDSSEPTWCGYIRGVLALYPHSQDVDIVIESTIPLGGGLSSSAALELAVLFFLRQLIEFIDDDEMRREDCAVMCRRAENIFAHVPCGIMDQMVVCLAEKGHALKIDCWNLTAESVPICAGDDTTFLVTDCGVRHKLANSEYSNRKESVENALKKLDCKSWRHIREDALIENSTVLDEIQMKHALHVDNYSGKPTFFECRPVAGVEVFPVDGIYNLL